LPSSWYNLRLHGELTAFPHTSYLVGRGLAAPIPKNLDLRGPTSRANVGEGKMM